MVKITDNMEKEYGEILSACDVLCVNESVSDEYYRKYGKGLWGRRWEPSGGISAQRV